MPLYSPFLNLICLPVCLQFGDRLLSVNGVQVTTFKDAMNALRSIPVGEKATLVFSRQEAVVATTPSLTTSPVDLSTDPSSRRASNTNLDLAFEPVSTISAAYLISGLLIKNSLLCQNISLSALM